MTGGTKSQGKKSQGKNIGGKKSGIKSRIPTIAGSLTFQKWVLRVRIRTGNFFSFTGKIREIRIFQKKRIKKD